MSPKALAPLLRLSPAKRADLAPALWESLEDGEREAAFPLTRDVAAELDRRIADHVADPSSAVPWSVVRRRLLRKR